MDNEKNIQSQKWDGESQIELLLGFPKHPAEQQRAGITAFEPHPNSKETTCAECDMDIYLGPFQFDYMKSHSGVFALCPLCAIRVSEGKFEVRNFGGRSPKMTWNHNA